MRKHTTRTFSLLLAGSVLVSTGLVDPTLAQPAGVQSGVAVATVDAGMPGQQASGAKDACADERDSVAAETGYEGPLLEMSKDALAACEHRAQAAQ